MKFGVIGALVVVLPISAMAQSTSQKQANLEDALRVRQLICNGIADVRARGGDYSAHDMTQCVIALEAQRAEYAQFMAVNAVNPSPRRIASAAASRPAQTADKPLATLAAANR
jgi:hypothetical protein